MSVKRDTTEGKEVFLLLMGNDLTICLFGLDIVAGDDVS